MFYYQLVPLIGIFSVGNIDGYSLNTTVYFTCTNERRVMKYELLRGELCTMGYLVREFSDRGLMYYV